MKANQLQKRNIFRFANESLPLIVINDVGDVMYLEDYAASVQNPQYKPMPWPIEPDTEVVVLL